MKHRVSSRFVGAMSATAMAMSAVMNAGMMVTSASDADANSTIDASAICCARAVRVDPPDAPRDRVAIVGDSLMVGVTAHSILGNETIQDRLVEQGRRVTLVNSRIGRTLAQGIDVIRSERAAIERSDIVLIGLGTNNVWGTAGSSEAEAAIEIVRVTEAVRTIDPDTIVIWIDLSVESVGARTSNFNEALTSVAQSSDMIEVCEWRDQAITHAGTFAPDGIHLTGPGYRARRDILLACIARQPG